MLWIVLPLACPDVGPIEVVVFVDVNIDVSVPPIGVPPDRCTYGHAGTEPDGPSRHVPHRIPVIWRISRVWPHAINYCWIVDRDINDLRIRTYNDDIRRRLRGLCLDCLLGC